MKHLDEARKFWKVASTFPLNKEEVYPAHAGAHEFDIQGQPGKRVLEYGCGAGSDTLSLLRRGARVVFADVTQENVETTRKNVDRAELYSHALGVPLERSDVLPFEDAFFDSINCHGVLHHITSQCDVVEPAPVVKAFFRVLKEGGHLYAMLYSEHLFKVCQDRVHAMMREQNWTEEFAFGYCTDGHGARSAYYTEESGRKLFEWAGFEFVSATLYNENHFRTFKLKKPQVG